MALEIAWTYILWLLHTRQRYLDYPQFLHPPLLVWYFSSSPSNRYSYIYESNGTSKRNAASVRQEIKEQKSLGAQNLHADMARGLSDKELLEDK